MFKGIYNLKYLALGLNIIIKLDNNTFEYLVNLIVLYLDRIHFKFIEQKMLMSLVNLRKLNLNLNKIIHIENNSFSDLIFLQQLYLSKNKIKKLFNKTFNNLLKISELHITFNKISHLDLNCFIKNMNLKLLNASNNEIISLSGNFLRIKSLQYLYLNNNSILSIRSIGLFEYLSLNNNIYLQNNQVNLGFGCEHKWILENYRKRSFNFHSNNLNIKWIFTKNNYTPHIDVNIFKAHCLFQYIHNEESCGYLKEIFNNYSALCYKGKLVY